MVRFKFAGWFVSVQFVLSWRDLANSDANCKLFVYHKASEANEPWQTAIINLARCKPDSDDISMYSSKVKLQMYTHKSPLKANHKLRSNYAPASVTPLQNSP